MNTLHAASSRVSRKELLSHLWNARMRTDELFSIIKPNKLYDRPIAERHRVVFYLGHLEAFEWNLICSGTFGLKSFNEEFDRLFAFGIDPTAGNLPDDKAGDWPREELIHAYNRRVRETVEQCLNSATDDEVFWAAIEHRLMHAETLAYMLHWLPREAKRRQLVSATTVYRQPHYRQIDIPAGVATLGVHPDDSTPFAWDNEYEEHHVEVPAFSIDQYDVTNGQFEKFVRAGGYQDRRFWSDEAWRWVTLTRMEHPKFWKPKGPYWYYLSMFGDVPFQPSWPVYVSHAEAEAYARWAGKSLPTEAQFHRAAFGTHGDAENRYPWGGEAPEPHHGNFDFARWNPSPVDAHPAGNSAFGVSDLVGNGWEWTSTVFEPFTGFKVLPFYPTYSANFFDGKHYVMKGGSPRTASLLLRRSFRNWFQPFYPNVYATFRCVQN
jgi:ergothioneine biosynthesis protein EgtB